MYKCEVMAASLIAIGDELLGGFTLDTNSYWLAQRLRVLGLPLLRKTTIKDREDDIIAAVRHDIAHPDVSHLFVMGGLGPTPDDRTFAALARALDRELIVWEETRARIERRVRRLFEAGLIESPEPTEGNLRMARIPAQPSHVFRNRRGMAPAALYEVDGTQLFVLPGVPMEMKGIFSEEIEPTYLAGRSAASVREVRFNHAAESRFYPLLRELEDSHPDVSAGSYPNIENRELVIRLIGDDPRRVDEAAALVRARAAAMGLSAAL
jgi:molybdenum cofactor synthesis domain-containing protein